MRTSLLLLLAALASTSLTGCLQTCHQLCVENAEYIEGCLEHWEALWADFGYDGLVDEEGADGSLTAVPHERGPAGEYVTTCVERYESAMSRSSPEGGRLMRKACETDIQQVAASVGCMDYVPNDIDLDPTED